MKKILFNLPEFLPSNKVLWRNTDYTFIVGMNGVGKTFLLNQMIAWSTHKNYSYAHYDSDTALNIVDDLIDSTSDEDIIYIAKLIMDFSMDFKDDVFNWTKAANNHSVDQIGPIGEDATLLRKIFHRAGNGYLRMFTILCLGVQKKGDLDYYFLDLPEASLHILLARKILDILMHDFNLTKFVITTHSPDIIEDKWSDENVISMKCEFSDEAEKFEFDEEFHYKP